MMNPTTFYMILAYAVSEVISKVPIDIQLKTLQDSVDFSVTYLAQPGSPLASPTDLELNTRASSKKQSKILLNHMLSLNWSHISNDFNYLSADEIWKSLQDVINNKAEDESLNPNHETEAFSKLVPRKSRSDNRTPRERAGEEIYQGLNVTAQAASHGYQAQEYTVHTNDGYILGLHRIRAGSPRGKPVLLMHGLLQNSASWLGAGPGYGLAYLLARAGHDVWLGNVRGSYYSREHVSLDPNGSSYWQFSADEIGKYDIPAIIDKVLNETGVDKLNYVGFSQGGGTFFIMCSELPHYCEKANVMIALAPSARHIQTKSPLFRFLSVFCEKYEKPLLDAGIYEVLPKNGLVQRFFNIYCRRSELSLALCELLKDAIDSQHPGSFTKESIISMVGDFPSGTSVHNMARYSQTLRSRNVRKFDYGPRKNLQIYGARKPPLYNLRAVTVPTVVVYGRNDGLVDITDVKWLIRQLPNVVEAFEVEDPLWTHLDVSYSQYVPRLLYPKVKEYLDAT